MKILFISNLFPDVGQPVRGLDNARLLQELARHVQVRALALRPKRFFALRRRRFEPRAEDALFAPRYIEPAYIPKVGSRWNHLLMARALRPSVEAVRREFPFDAVLCAWVYPDGCAVARLADELNFPFVVIAQGSDVHQYLKIPARRKIIPPAMNRARGVITRSGDLARLLQSAGVHADRLHTIYNGVDFERFHPADKRDARRELGLPEERKIILYVGNFFPVKNPLLLVAAHQQLVECAPKNPPCLVMLGGGELREEAGRALRERIANRLAFLPGKLPPERVARYMQAADVLCVPSDNEGVPNVILEAFASGLRVVATDVGGISEVLREKFLGTLVARGDRSALFFALQQTLADQVETARIIGHAAVFSWETTARAYLDALQANAPQKALTGGADSRQFARS